MKKNNTKKRVFLIESTKKNMIGIIKYSAKKVTVLSTN